MKEVRVSQLPDCGGCMDVVNSLYIVQNGRQFYTAIRLACNDDNGKPLSHLLVISGPFDSYELADRKRKEENV